MHRRKILKYALACFLIVVAIGFALPRTITIPVAGASSSDWDKQSFWYEPWGTSGTHKGIDIFGVVGRPIVAATTGVVLYSGQLSKGGNVVAILGPKWQVHYYAHLQLRSARTGQWVRRSEEIGKLGASGNAAGKPPHLHYSIFSLVPLPWLATSQTQGWKRMFYLDPSVELQ